MPLQSIELPGRRSRAHELHSALRDAILDGTVTAGERLIEKQIAALASVSRTPVREAIRRLQAEGLIQDSGSGPVAMTLNSGVLADMCEVRESLEGLACRLAALRHTGMGVLTLADLADRWSDAVARDAPAEDFIRLNTVFHETIWQIAGNRYLADQLGTLRSRIELTGQTTLRDRERQVEAMGEHLDIVTAIKARDSDKAGELARHHFQRAMAIRLASLPFDATVARR
jgi:DNA-binding GntR family transcriptional regulator